MKPAALLACGLLWAGGAHAVDKISMDSFTENRKSKSEDATAAGAHKSVSKSEEKELSAGSLVIESALQTYQKFNNRLRVPGFIASSPIPPIGRIVGPTGVTSFRMGDSFFVRWQGAPLPKPGDRYSTYSPAVVLQNLENPSDFEVFNAPGPTTKLPKDRRLAGYFYETSGRLRVVKIKGGLVVCMLEGLSGQVQVGDQLMLTPPLVENITPINSGIQLSASVVSGSPADRLSTTRRSYLYINRGSRDGVRVGRVFQSVETVPLESSVGGPAPELSNGEAIVVHVTDSYATAMITKQFDVVRIGSLLRTKQEDNPVDPKAPFTDFVEIKATNAKPDQAKADQAIPEIPSLDKLPGATDDTLPEPRKRPSAPMAQLSELDELEQSMKMKSLTPAEKARLDKLSHQERLGADKEEGDDVSDTPGAPSVENSFKDSKKSAKKPPKKKAKNKNDEEDLNNLMMQN